MEAEIADIIERHIPAQVGTVLRKRLEKADADARLVAEQSAKIQELRGYLEVANGKAAAAEKILAREAYVAENERKLASALQEYGIKNAVLQAQSQLINGMLDRYDGIVRSVFGNNQLKYQESITRGHLVPSQTPGCSPMTVSTTENRTVTGEGISNVPAALPPQP